MSLDELGEIWVLPISFDLKDVLISGFKIAEEYSNTVFSISYYDDISFKIKDLISSDFYDLKLFDNNIKFKGQIPLVIYGSDLNELLEVEKNIAFEYEEYPQSNPDNLDESNEVLNNDPSSRFLESHYEFGDYVSYSNNSLQMSVVFSKNNLIIEADIDNVQFLKDFISSNFNIPKYNIIFKPVNRSWNNSLFSISFNAIIHGIIISKKTSKKVNIIYYGRHLSIVNESKFNFSAKNYMQGKSKLSHIDLKVEFNRPLNFLYKFYLERIKLIFKDLFFDGFLRNIEFIENPSQTLFFYDNLILLKLLFIILFIQIFMVLLLN